MATFVFPTSPTVGQTYTFSTKTWVWTGYAWVLQANGAINNLPIGNATPSTGVFTTLQATTSANLGTVANVYIAGGTS